MRNSRRRGRFSKQATATKYDVVSDAQRKRWEANVVLSQHNYSTTASEDDKTDSGVLLDLADDTSNVRDAPILATAQEEIVSIICEIYLLLMTFINYRHSLSHWSICVSYTRSTARTCKSKQLITECTSTTVLSRSDCANIAYVFHLFMLIQCDNNVHKWEKVQIKSC